MKIINNKKRKNSVFGIFSDQSALDRAIEILKSQHFRNSDITVLVPSNKNSHNDISFRKQTKAPEGLSIGVITGIVLGFIMGWLLGRGIMVIEGLEPIAQAGAFMGAVAGAGLGGTIGAIIGGLVGLALPEYEVQKYENKITQNGMLLTVHIDDRKWERRARQILDDNGATHISLAFEKKLKTNKTKTTYARPVYQESHLTQPNLQTRIELGSELRSHSNEPERTMTY